MTADLLQLAAQVEALTGACRETDAEIAEKVYGWKRTTVGPDYDGNNAGEVLTPNGRLIPGFSYPPRGRIHLGYHVEEFTRDCRDHLLPRDSVRKKTAAALRARAAISGGAV